MNPYIILGVVAFWIGSVYFSYEKGQADVALKAEKAALEYRENEIKLIKKIEEARKEREVIYRDKVHVIQGANDPTGCLDTPFPDDFVAGLRSASDTQTKREYHR